MGRGRVRVRAEMMADFVVYLREGRKNFWKYRTTTTTRRRQESKQAHFGLKKKEKKKTANFQDSYKKHKLSLSSWINANANSQFPAHSMEQEEASVANEKIDNNSLCYFLDSIGYWCQMLLPLPMPLLTTWNVALAEKLPRTVPCPKKRWHRRRAASCL